MSQPFLISVRAIEDIIHIQKPGENPRLASLGEVEEVVYSVNSLGSSCTFAEENDSSSLQEFKVTVLKSDSDNSKISQRVIKTGSEGDYYSFRNSSVESLRLTGEADCEAELRSWPSDSDITVLRMRKEFRNELSAKVEWEEERHLTDASSHNLDWESHSLINLADVLKDKDQAEGLTPFTIWTKGNQASEPAADTAQDPSSHTISYPAEEKLSDEKVIETHQESTDVASPETEEQKMVDSGVNALTENKVAEMVRPYEDANQSGANVSRPSKSKLIRDFFRSILLCSSKKNTLDETNSY